MKIITWNVNGLRAVYKKNLVDWIFKEDADLYCFQEIKASKDKVPQELLELPGYKAYVNPAIRPGYSGTMILSKKEPNDFEMKIGFDNFDREGRVITLFFGNLAIINLYMPNGGRAGENMDYKLLSFMKLRNYLEGLKKGGKKIVFVGDINIAHKEIDLARPKENKKSTGFTPSERMEIDNLVNDGFVDIFREYNSEGGHYTWWSHFANARERNIGWRIDYAFITPDLKDRVKKVQILTEVLGSDHCPVLLELI
jgi:exodeoxyribonuclease III